MWVFAMCSVSARRLESRVIEMESVRGAKPYGSTAGLTKAWRLNHRDSDPHISG